MADKERDSLLTAAEAADFLGLATMRAVRTIGPALRLKVFTGGGFVAKDGGGYVDHGSIP